MISNTGTPGEFEAGFDKDAVVQIGLRVMPAEAAFPSEATWIALVTLLGLGLLGAIATAGQRRATARKPTFPLAVGAAAIIV